MARVEPQDVQDFWAVQFHPLQTEPTFQDIEFIYDLEGENPKVCCIYAVLGPNEYCYVISQQKLDQRHPSVTGSTNHIKAMQRFRLSQNMMGELFNCIVGFYYEIGIKKMTSCVNYFTAGTRAATQAMQEQFNAHVFPEIEDEFRSFVTQCIGTTQKGLQCKRRVRDLACAPHK
ncbi:uncharacterized protein LOC110856251 [Folsomia candida]|uniref:Uncharacterized protein n=1 Tax=Folsomia candida TaxID=158441 RepID=A0A226DM44_FOLCA|nr:uncharacterized protein LOC110856251 [Folsomia candida]XP_035712935.1 uncharacterized protein LOC110856251 [Folsomia candida]OXA46602.1 hypothetical protein Fcan01_18885 [Folsomia candida]